MKDLEMQVKASMLKMADDKEGRRSKSERQGHFFKHKLREETAINSVASGLANVLKAVANKQIVEYFFYEGLRSCKSSIERKVYTLNYEIRNEQELRYCIGDPLAQTLSDV